MITKRKIPSKITRLARELDDMAKRCVEYRREGSSTEAEYCQTFGYGEGIDKRYHSLSEELESKVTALRLLDPEKFLERLASVCALELTDMRTTDDDEIFSIQIGEVEEQMDEKLAKRVKALNPGEVELLRREMTEACLGHNCIDCIYISMEDERWVMRVQETDLDDLLRQLGWVEQAKAEVPNVLLTESPEVRRAAFRLIMGGAA